MRIPRRPAGTLASSYDGKRFLLTPQPRQTRDHNIASMSCVPIPRPTLECHARARLANLMQPTSSSSAIHPADTNITSGRKKGASLTHRRVGHQNKARRRIPRGGDQPSSTVTPSSRITAATPSNPIDKGHINTAVEASPVIAGWRERQRYRIYVWMLGTTVLPNRPTRRTPAGSPRIPEHRAHDCLYSLSSARGRGDEETTRRLPTENTLDGKPTRPRNHTLPFVEQSSCKGHII